MRKYLRIKFHKLLVETVLRKGWKWKLIKFASEKLENIFQRLIIAYPLYRIIYVVSFDECNRNWLKKYVWTTFLFDAFDFEW